MKGELKTMDGPVVREGQVSTIQPVQKTIKVPQFQFRDRAANVPVVAQRQRPQERIIEETPVPHMMEKTTEVTKPIPQVRVQQRTVEQIVDVPVPQIVEEIVEVVQIIPQERISERVVEQISDMPASQIEEKTVETIPLIPQNQISDRIVEQTVKVVKAIPQECLDIPGVAQKQSVMVQKSQTVIEIPQVQHIDKVIDVPVVVQRQVPQSQFTDRCVDVRVLPEITQQRHVMIEHVVVLSPVPQMMDVSEVKRRRVSTGIQTDRTVEVPRVIPQERILKPAGERASVRERVRQFERNRDASCSNNVEVPRTNPDDRQNEDPEDEAQHKRRKQESDPDLHAPVHFSLCDDSSNQEAKSMDDSAELETRPRGVPVGQLDDVLLEVRDVKTELLQVRELVGVLVRRERCAEVKTEVAARRLERMEREKDDVNDAEHEADLQEALANQTKAVRLVVDKWFVDRGFGFGRTTTGEIVFIHASVVQGAEVLMVGTDAWAQVVSDHARAEGGFRARRAWGRNAWKAERDKENANRVAQQVRRAAALTAELAAQSEKKTAAVCDQPPGLDELAGHIEAPNMGAGGSHPQATMMSDPWASGSRPSASEKQAMTSAPSEINSLALLSQGSFVFPGRVRGARPKSTTRAQDNAAMLEETLSLFVEATGKDEASMRQKLMNERPEELRRNREFWRTRVEEKQRFQMKKKEAWEFFRRLPSFSPKKQEDFEEKFKRKVMTGYSSGSVEGQERYLDEWTVELRKKALEEDRRLEARERTKMGEEDSSSRRRTEWERILERPVLSPFLKAAP